jgi:hypothetical protein
MPPQLLIGMLIGAGAAGLVILILTGRLLPRRSDRNEAVRRGTLKSRTMARQVLDPEQVEAADNLPADVPRRADDLPFVVEKRATQKIVVNVNGEVHEYDSLKEVPAEFRALIEKARRSGRARITIEVNRKRYSYNSRDEVPPEFRRFLPPPAEGGENSEIGGAEGPGEVRDPTAGQ